jgi:hypothetical protein
MILSHKNHDDIISLLLKYGSCTAKQIYEYLTQWTEDSITLAQLYNILKILYQCQIISKYDKKYHINTIWIDQLEQVVLAHRNDHQMIDWSNLDIWKHIILKASNLGELDPIRWDVFHGLGKQSGLKKIYTYNTHLYHVIGMHETEKAFFGSGSYQFYNIVQHKNSLNDYGSILYSQMWVDQICYSSKNLLFGTEGRVINVIWDYIIDFLMPEILEHYFAYHFNTVQDMSQFNQVQFNSLFQMPIQCQLKIIYDPELANQYRRMIQNQLK